MTRFVLASGSADRRRVLRDAGIDPVVLVSGVDEDALVAALPDDAGPGDVTGALATAKAQSVASSLSADLSADCVVIGCDTLLLVGDRLCGKPTSAADARRQWHAMAGLRCVVLTGHCVVRMAEHAATHRVGAVATAAVQFGTPSDDELTAYLNSGEPMGRAGSFTLNGLGGWFVDGVEGEPSAVVGIGLATIRRLIAQTGVSVSALWRSNSVDV